MDNAPVNVGPPSRFPSPERLERVDVPVQAEKPLFRFGLRQLFLAILALSILLAGLVSADGMGALVLLLAACVVAVHIFATALGSRLRADADESAVWQPNRRQSHAAGVTLRSRRSPWHGRGSTALPWLPRLILAGASVGGLIGVVLLVIAIGHRASTAGVVIGSLSAAVLGGWFAFLGGSFYGIFRHGLRDALAEQQKEERR